VTRADQLHWWQQGYEIGFAAGLRQQAQQEDLGAYRLAVAEFRDRRQADRQAVIDALLLDVVDILSKALFGNRNQPEETPLCPPRPRPRGNPESS